MWHVADLSQAHQTLATFLKVFLTIFSENLEVIGLAKLDSWLDQFTNVLLHACHIDMILFMPKTVLALILIFQKFCFIRMKRQNMSLFLTINYFFLKNHPGRSYELQKSF